MDKRLTISLCIALLTLTGCNLSSRTSQPEVSNGLTELEAKTIAEETCIKGGESLSVGSYNDFTKTWWFDANLNAVKEGCNPACVVSEETNTAEINWRCTGLIQPEENLENNLSSGENPVEELSKLFAEKYPKYADTVSVNLTMETATHVRGNVIFEEGAPGGYFFAVKSGDVWEIVSEGNGQIACTLSEYGFPEDMLFDCAE